MNDARSLSLSQKLLYACGQGGNVIGDTLIQTFLLRFYLPPGEQGLLPDTILGVLPAWVAINLFARFVDAVADPVVAARSDASRHRMGRRRVFMAYGVLPLAVSTAAVFFPPDTSSPQMSNFAFLLAAYSVYFVAFTVYVAPYLALLPDIAQSVKERTDLSTLQAIAAIAGASLPGMVGPIVFFTKDGVFRDEMPALAVAMSALSLLLMLLPIAWVREPQLARGDDDTDAPPAGVWTSVRASLDELRITLQDPHFRWYLIGTVAFFFAFNLVRAAAPYYVEVLMRRPLEELGLLMAATFGTAFVGFFVVNPVALAFGHRKVMLVSALLLAVVLGFTPVVDNPTHGYVLMALVGLPIAALLSVPNAMLANISAAHAKREGVKREAMFFGAQGFFMKVNLGVSSAALGLLLSTMGNSVGDDLGVRLSGPMGSVVLVFAAFAFSQYTAPDVDVEVPS